MAFAVALGLLISGTLSVAISSSHDVGSPSPGTVRSFSGGSLPSWNPNVACGADLVAVRDVLGSAYPNQALIGSRYQTSSTAGGVPNKRQLLAPCTITNVTGQSISSFVEIHGVYLNPYTLNSGDCSHGFAPINGGKLYPDGKQYCDNVGDILALGTTSGRIHIEFDQDWLAKGWCGSQTIWCNNVSALEYVSLGSISLDVQGFVYWDDNHWEVHPLTAMRLSAGFTVSADPTSLETIRNYTTRANVKVLGASPDPVALSLSGCPSATVCTLSPASGSPIFASSLRVNTSAASPRGTFNLVIGAANASLSRSVTIPLTIGDRVLATFHRGDGGLFSETDDTSISNSAPNTNFGKELTLQVDGTCDTAGIVCKSLVKFPLIVGQGDGQIPSNTTVLNASLVLFIKDPGDAETLYQVTEPWTESGATWNSFTTPGTPGNRGPEFQITPKPVNKFLSINITAIAQRWVNGDVNQGILLASTLGDGTLYNSSESNAGRPTLRVEFVLPFDFSLSTSPSSGFVPVHGESATVTVTARYTSGPGHSVQYSCASLPTGTTCTFSPPTCSPSCTANLVLATSSSTPAGTYAMSIQATDGTITRTSAFTLTVGDPLLAYDMETLTGTGQMKDLSGHGNDGTITGTADVPGKVGQAKHFNAGDRITAPAISVPATDFTVAGWFRWTTNPTPYYSGIHGGGGSWELRVMADGRFGATFYQSIGPDVFTEIVSPLAYNDGEWHHAAAVLLSGLVRLYVDGVLVAQDSTNPISSVRPSTQTVTGHVASDFVGDIDEVLVYSRALTGAEIAAIAPPPPADGPVLRYDMETLLLDGRMKDLSGHANHGTLSGTSSVLGKVGQATHFNAGDRITAPAISVPATDFTVAAWFRWTTNPSPYYSGIHGGGGSWELRVMADGRFGATFYQSVGPDVFTEIVSPLAYNDGEWHHAAAVLRNGLVRLYVDGMLVAQDSTNPITSVRPSTQTIIGRVASDFVGDIDEFLIYTRVLSDAEIASIAPPPPADAPVLRYDMETLIPDGRMKDLSGHVNHGTIVGTSSVLGKVGQATHFDGTGDRITAPAISVPATDFTVAGWFRWTTNPSPYYSGIHGGGGSWELRVMADGRFGATFYQSIGPDVFTEIVSPLAYNDGAWHHAAAVLRNGLVVIYVDGAIKASDATGPISSVRSSTSVQIGHVASDFGGDIDEVLVYPRALSDAEIAALVGGPTSSVQYLGAKLPFRASPSFTPSSWSPPPNVSLTVATFPSSQNSSRVVTAIAESDCSVSRKKGSSLPVDAANCHGPKTWINPTGAFSQK